MAERAISRAVDDVNQPVDLKAAADFNRVIRLLAETVANESARPQWNQDSFFRRFAAHGE